MLNCAIFYATYIVAMSKNSVHCFHATLRDGNCLFGVLEDTKHQQGTTDIHTIWVFLIIKLLFTITAI